MAVPKFEPSTPSAMGYFSQIPPEMRDLIYKLVFQHNISLTRTSKAMYIDTKPSLYKYNTLRITIYSNQWTNCIWTIVYEPPYNVLAKTENVDISIKLYKTTYQRENKLYALQ